MDTALKAYEEQQAKRPIYVFDLPPEIVELNDSFIKKSVGLVKLTMREELAALDLAGGSAAKAGYYMVMAALVEVDGKLLNKGDGEDEKVLNGTDPAIRSLIVEAQTDLGGAAKKSADTFLKSRKVKVG
jgi:hypothetical protein